MMEEVFISLTLLCLLFAQFGIVVRAWRQVAQLAVPYNILIHPFVDLERILTAALVDDCRIQVPVSSASA